MQFRKLGNSDLNVSVLCLGTMTMGWQNDEATSHRILDCAFDAGINFIDTADVYSRWAPGNPGGVSETYIGNWLRQPSSIGNKRDKVILATKVRGRMWDGDDGEGLSEKHIMRAIDDSLRRLRVDYVELYQCHAPDLNTPVEETWNALSKLVKAGKVKYLGLSNFSGEQHSEVISVADQHGLPRPLTTQPKYNLTLRGEFESGILPVVQSANIAMIPYSPLEGGLLTGKYRTGQSLPENARHTLNGRANDKLTPQVIAILDELERIARLHNASIAQIALAWLLHFDWMTSPIIGATSLAQLEELIPAADLILTDEEFQALENISRETGASPHIQRGPV